MSTSSIATTRGAPPAAPRSSGRDRAVALALVLGAQLMIILDMTVVNVALPSIARDLHFSADRAVLGAQRLHADVRRPAAARRPGRGHPRPAPGVHGRSGAVHRGLAGRRPGHVGQAAAGRPGGAGRGRRDRHPRRAGADHRQLPRGPGAHPRARPVHRRGHGRRVARPGPRRRDRPVGELALGAVRQRADRRAGAGARAAVPVRDPAAAGALRPGRGTVLDRRHVRAGVRVHPGRRGGLAGPADPGCAGCCAGAARPVPAERGAGGAADHAAAAVRRPRAGGLLPGPAAARRGHVRDVLPADPVRAG